MNVFWLEQTGTDVPENDDWLAGRERLYVERLRIPKRRSDWRLGRWTAKRAIAAFLRAPYDPEMLARIEIRSAASGAPLAFRENAPAAVSISITHRCGIAACAVAPPEMAIGCDLELIEPRSDAFLTDYFTVAEQALLARFPAAERVVFSNLLWSAKESALKVLKVGLRIDTRCVEVSLGENPPTEAEEFLRGLTHSSNFDEPRPFEEWFPLSVCCANGQSFRGWWMPMCDLVRTIVTAPSAGAPLILRTVPH